MCRFKSGIILKDKVVIAPEDNDSHSDLLESLGIEDSYIGASKTFVRAELVPKNDSEWWIDPAWAVTAVALVVSNVLWAVR